MEERNDIVIYKSEDVLVKMEAMVDPVNETIWANQKAITALFDVTVSNISYHFKKIFESGELGAGTVVKDFLITAQSGARGTSDEKVKYYIPPPDIIVVTSTTTHTVFIGLRTSIMAFLSVRPRLH